MEGWCEWLKSYSTVWTLRLFTNMHLHLFYTSPEYLINEVQSLYCNTFCFQLTVHIFTLRSLSQWPPVDIKSPQSHGPGLRSLPETPSCSGSLLHFIFNNIAAFWKGTSTLCVNLWYKDVQYIKGLQNTCTHTRSHTHTVVQLTGINK